MHLLTQAAGRGDAWDVVCVASSEETFEHEDTLTRTAVAIEHHAVRPFYAKHAPHARLCDRTVRAEYDLAMVQRLQPYRPDIVILAGYLLVLTEPMLDAFPGRIINVHHSDLALRKASGAPRYPGLRAVRDAILAGERETRSSVHLVTRDLDDGPVILRSRPYLVPEVARWAIATGEHDVLRRVIWAHQEWMLRTSFGPLMEQALARVLHVESVA
jgi:folate-dependent phosphoribosylglycinamide formyltransferase PurN